MKDFSFFLDGRKLRIKVVEAGFFRKGFGLMFRSSRAKPVLFDFGRNVRVSLTSLFVFFPFKVFWLDDKNNVIYRRLVRPFEFSVKCPKRFHKVLEIPLIYWKAESSDFPSIKEKFK